MTVLGKQFVPLLGIFALGSYLGGNITSESRDAERLFVLEDIVNLRAVAVFEERILPEAEPDERWILNECANLRESLDSRRRFRTWYASFLNFIEAARKRFSRRGLSEISVAKHDSERAYALLSRIETRLSTSGWHEEVSSRIDKGIAAQDEIQDRIKTKGAGEW